MNLMLLGQGWDKVFGHTPKAGLHANVAAVKNLGHKGNNELWP